jgi:hypothetical protein
LYGTIEAGYGASAPEMNLKVSTAQILKLTSTGIDVTGNIGVSGTVDGIDIAARDAVLTSTTTTAGAALPKAGGTMTGTLVINQGGSFSKLDMTTSRTGATENIGGVQFYNSSNALRSQMYGTNDGKLKLATNGSTVALTLDASQNATFAGGITATYANLSSAVNALYFRTAAANTDYNLITRNSTGNALFIQSAQSNTNQPIANFRYGSATVNQGTPVLQVSKDNSHFVNCNVGIGTATPAYKLDLAGAMRINASRATFVDASEDATAAAHIFVSNDGVGDFSQLSGNLVIQARVHTSVYRDIIFAGGINSASALMTIAGEGNVGIGTNTPSSPLQVVKNASSNTTPIATFSTTTADDYGIVEINSGADNNYRPSTLRFKEGGNLKWEIGGTYQLVDDSFGIRNSSGAYKMVIQEAGNVGIGTDAPAYPLEVAGTTSTSIAYQRTGVSAKKWGFHTDNDNTYWQNITDNVLALTIKNNGNVGIGTTSPTTAKLDVAGTALVENAKLKAIAASNSDTARDVFVYDTRKDSDGGAWRKRTQNTSWYNEASGTNRS